MQNETFTDINGFCPILFRQKELLMSIDGVGRVAAANMIITTEAFTHFDAPRKELVLKLMSLLCGTTKSVVFE